MALRAANVRYGQVPFRALGSASRRNIEIMRVVTVVAGGLDACLALGPGMKGVLVRLDVLYHHPQPGFFCRHILLLDGFPQLLVTGHAIGFGRGDFFVRRFVVGNILMTRHASHFSMDAFCILVLLDRSQRADFSVCSGQCKYLFFSVMAGHAACVIQFRGGLSGARVLGDIRGLRWRLPNYLGCCQADNPRH